MEATYSNKIHWILEIQIERATLEQSKREYALYSMLNNLSNFTCSSDYLSYSFICFLFLFHYTKNRVYVPMFSCHSLVTFDYVIVSITRIIVFMP